MWRARTAADAEQRSPFRQNETRRLLAQGSWPTQPKREISETSNRALESSVVPFFLWTNHESEAAVLCVGVRLWCAIDSMPPRTQLRGIDAPRAIHPAWCLGGRSHALRLYYPLRAQKRRVGGWATNSLTADSASCLASSELRVPRPSESVVEAVRSRCRSVVISPRRGAASEVSAHR